MIEAIFTPEAQEDVAHAYDWYESREPGLGEEFLRCIEGCLCLIGRHPQAYPLAVDQFRHAPIRRFPFEIFYEETGGRIVVFSVFHCSQDPAKWKKQLGSK